MKDAEVKASIDTELKLREDAQKDYYKAKDESYKAESNRLSQLREGLYAQEVGFRTGPAAQEERQQMTNYYKIMNSDASLPPAAATESEETKIMRFLGKNPRYTYAQAKHQLDVSKDFNP